MIRKAYKYRLYPTEQQKEFLAKCFGANRWLWNDSLQKKIRYYNIYGKSLSRFQLQPKLKKLKKQKNTYWLSEIPHITLTYTLMNLETAYKNFFRTKKGFPKFKSKKNKQSIQFYGGKVDFNNNKLKVIKFQEGIKCIFHRQFEGKIKTITISKTKTDKYFASILVEENINLPKKVKQKYNKAIGIDLGLKSFIVTSDNKVFENPKYLKQSEQKLKLLQRRLSRKSHGSSNRNKQRIKVAKQHEKITNQRRDYLHKISRKLINDNQVTTFCVENLNVSGMVKNHHLAQAINDVGWSTFIEFLTYKAEWSGKNIIQIDRFAPSSKTCNNCGYVNKDLTLADRKWQYPQCEIIHDRDYLAACNIKDFAFQVGRGTSEPNVSGDYVRLSHQDKQQSLKEKSCV